ncbi:MAG: isochorismatase family protein [Lachnospiraceae bacterium]|nr:isochorismatase family protein [Lachnospiraceae bacterium]
MRITKENAIVLVVDIQERLLPAMAHKEDVLKNSVILLKGAVAHGVPVIATEQYPKGLGSTLAEVKEAAPDMWIHAKGQFSCLEPEVNAKLDELIASGRDTVVIIGMEAHVCVLLTIRDLIEKGFKVVMAADCVASRKDFDKEMAFERAKFEGAVLSTYEAILFEMTETSKDANFKTISNLVK